MILQRTSTFLACTLRLVRSLLLLVVLEEGNKSRDVRELMGMRTAGVMGKETEFILLQVV